MNFLRELWERERGYTIAWAGDLFRGVLTLAGLFIFYGFIEIGKLLGYHKEWLDLLELIDFGVAVATVVITGLLFLGKLWAGRKPPTSDRPARNFGARKK